MYKMWFVFLLGMVLGGCSGSTDEAGSSPGSNAGQPQAAVETPAGAGIEPAKATESTEGENSEAEVSQPSLESSTGASDAPPSVVPSAADIEGVVRGNNATGLELYRRLSAEQGGGNLFFSPWSISEAMAMVYTGAEGTTQRQIAEVFHFTAEKDSLGASFAELMKQWFYREGEKAYELRMAGRLWPQTGYELVPAYVESVMRWYGAPVRPLDFAGDSEGARDAINTWVEAETEGKIKELIGPGQLSAATRLVLTNAIYFNGSWMRPFEKEDTTEQPFHVTADRQVPVPLMRQTDRFGYAETESAQILKMPYKGNDLSMLILLPRQADGLDELEKNLTAENLARWTDGLENRKVEVYVPRFRLDARYLLKGPLSAMGMAEAFGPQADLSGISSHEQTFLSEVIHQAFVDVYETGTEAAAATAAAVLGAAPMPEALPVFRADRPFVFLIREETTGGILFIGRLVEPAAPSP